MANITFNKRVLVERIEEGAVKGLVEFGKSVGIQSQAKIPNDTGELRKSLFINIEGTDLQVGFDKEYAALVHEGTEKDFQRGKEAKYLESSFKQESSNLEGILGKNIKL